MAKFNVCPVCGKLITSDPTRRAIYCSTKCRQKAYRLRKKAQAAPKPAPFRERRECMNCGKKFTATHTRQIYCSQRCKNAVNYQQRVLKKKDYLSEREVYAEYVGSR